MLPLALEILLPTSASDQRENKAIAMDVSNY
jgi:hypothetical protein